MIAGLCVLAAIQTGLITIVRHQRHGLGISFDRFLDRCWSRPRASHLPLHRGV